MESFGTVEQKDDVEFSGFDSPDFINEEINHEKSLVEGLKDKARKLGFLFMLASSAVLADGAANRLDAQTNLKSSAQIEKKVNKEPYKVMSFKQKKDPNDKTFDGPEFKLVISDEFTQQVLSDNRMIIDSDGVLLTPSEYLGSTCDNNGCVDRVEVSSVEVDPGTLENRSKYLNSSLKYPNSGISYKSINTDGTADVFILYHGSVVVGYRIK